MKAVYLIFALLLVACQQPTDDGPKSAHTVIVKNSKWETVKTYTIYVSRAAAAADLNDAQAEADAYNYETIDDFWRVYIDEAPDIDNAPPVTVYVCNPENNNVNSFWENISRRSLVDNYALWKSSFYGQVLYIDHVPPPPIQDKDVNPYAWYALTIVDNDTGDAIYEDHCGFNPDQTWDSDTIDPNGIDQYYSIRLNAFNTAVQSPVEDANGVMHPNCRVVTRQVYVKPSTI